MYLDWFTFPDGEQEVDFFYGIQRTCYDSYYPFQVLSKRKFCRIDFERWRREGICIWKKRV